uniref:CAP domain-containing protein (inferred by orthology to a zebrafish protein) n=1 Tax=Strongyloides venezuelensis TaxID=75913 RepID=A0A0K0G1Z3_STRVS
MNFILTIVLYVNVISHVVIGPISNPLYDSDHEDSYYLKNKNPFRRRSDSLNEYPHSSHKKGNNKKHNRKNKNSHKNSNRHSPNWDHDRNPLPSLRSSLNDKYKGFNLGQYLSTNRFSRNLFFTIWRGFDYTHYDYDNYSLFKQRIIEHINLIRKYHRVESLRWNIRLTNLAEEHAGKMARQHKLFNVNSPYFGILVSVIYYPAASVVVSKWYDERFRYNYFLSTARAGTQSFTQILWKSTTTVGVGVAKSGDLLYIALFFYPKGNIRGQYRSNVLKKRIQCFGRK